MWAHLWTHSADPPQDYIELFLCRDVYHCTPDVLKRQNVVTIFRHLKIMEIEQKIEKLRSPNKRNAQLQLGHNSTRTR